ncbi:unnamed protein product [[Candida] boidinii]|nr:unnamed protein product [[Candida] boidinii]
MKDDTNNTLDKLVICFTASLIFCLVLCCFPKTVNLILENRYIRLVLDEVKKFILRGGLTIPVFFKYYPKWRNNEADFWDKISCVVGAISLLLCVGGIIWSCYQLCARIWNLYGYQRDDNNHRNTTATSNIRALEEGVLYHTNGA